jgi:4-azaleucine resistance transporter AzlC
MMQPARREFLAGIRAQLPILLGTTPFGMIYGIAAADAGLPVEVALGMSLIVFAGSAQFIAAQLFADNTPGLIIVLTTFIVNLRHMLYSASLAPYVRHLRAAWKYVLSFLLTDEAYAVTITHYRQDDVAGVRNTNKHWFFLGAGLTLWVSWQISTAVGVLLGAEVPASWSLEFTLPLTFIALLIPTLTDRPAVLAMLVAGFTAVLANDLPYNLGLIVAVLVGIAAGMWAEQHQARQPALPCEAEERV